MDVPHFFLSFQAFPVQAFLEALPPCNGRVFVAIEAGVFRSWALRMCELSVVQILFSRSHIPQMLGIWGFGLAGFAGLQFRPFVKSREDPQRLRQRYGEISELQPRTVAQKARWTLNTPKTPMQNCFWHLPFAVSLCCLLLFMLFMQ